MFEEAIPATRDHAHRAFISYSHRDKTFAQQLDTSLRLAGIEVERDERSVRVGDSIPDWVYATIGQAATCLIYVVSEHSVLSPWVREELSVAKVRQMSQQGFRVLPVLVDDVELPTAVAHIKAADFREWRNSTRFRASMLELLQGIGVTPAVVDSDLVAWWLRRVGILRSVAYDLATARGVADIAVGYPQWFESLAWFARQDRDSNVYNWAVPELERLLAAEDCPSDSRLGKLRVLIQDLRPGVPAMSYPARGRPSMEDHDKARLYRDRVDEATGLLAELELEVLSLLAATVGTSD